MPDPTITIKMPDAAPVAAAPTPVAGFKSTEFGITIVALLGAAAGVLPAQYAAALAALYIAGRSLLKAAHALGYAKTVPDLPDILPLAAGQTSTTVTTVQGTAP